MGMGELSELPAGTYVNQPDRAGGRGVSDEGAIGGENRVESDPRPEKRLKKSVVELAAVATRIFGCWRS